MVRLRHVEPGERHYLGLDLNFLRGLYFVARLFGHFLLLIIVIEDCCFVLRRPGTHARIVGFPEAFEKIAVRDHFRVIVYPDAFRMVSQAMVRRIQFRSSGIADPCANNAFDAPELGIGTPESAQRERRRFDRFRSGGIYGRWNSHPVGCCSFCTSFHSYTSLFYRFISEEPRYEPQNYKTHTKQQRPSSYTMPSSILHRNLHVVDWSIGVYSLMMRRHDVSINIDLKEGTKEM